MSSLNKIIYNLLFDPSFHVISNNQFKINYKPKIQKKNKVQRNKVELHEMILFFYSVQFMQLKGDRIIFFLFQDSFENWLKI